MVKLTDSLKVNAFAGNKKSTENQQKRNDLKKLFHQYASIKN